MDWISRRFFLRNVGAASVATAALTVPVIAEAKISSLSPEDRIRAALEEVEATMREAYPDWRTQTLVTPHYCEYPDGSRKLESLTIGARASGERFGREELMFYVRT